VPGSRPVNSTVPPPTHQEPKKSPFNRSEFEVFAHHTSGATGDAHGDKLLEWATHPKFKPDWIRNTKMRTMGKKAVDLNIHGEVMSRDLSEKADGSQRIVLFFRSLYDAIKQLANKSRFAGKQYTQFEMVHTADRKRKYGAINRGEMYDIAQGFAGADCPPMPVFLSSDTTVMCKHMGAHPTICECPRYFLHTCLLVCACIGDVSVYICNICAFMCMYEHKLAKYGQV
jgi:hypothetical protein